jgi:small subunit ribosomal protein S8e
MATKFMPRTKTSGGMKRTYRKKRVYETVRVPTHTLLGKRKVRQIRVHAGIMKTVLISDNSANIVDKSGKCKKVKILNVIGNPADSQFVRRNIITRGAIIETELGKARVTSRPGQEGTINAVLI